MMTHLEKAVSPAFYPTFYPHFRDPAWSRQSAKGANVTARNRGTGRPAATSVCFCTSLSCTIAWAWEVENSLCPAASSAAILRTSTNSFSSVTASQRAASLSINFKTFSHSLGETGTIFCAEKRLAAKLKRGFPNFLHDAPALLPAENTTLRRVLIKRASSLLLPF